MVKEIKIRVNQPSSVGDDASLKSLTPHTATILVGGFIVGQRELNSISSSSPVILLRKSVGLSISAISKSLCNLREFGCEVGEERDGR
jgi:YbbR domain-containing protein